LLAAIAESGYDSDAVHEYARRGSETVWANEENIADPETIVKIANASGLQGSKLLESAREKRELTEQEAALTQEAIERQYFGGPIYVYRDEQFWGQDRLEMLDEVLRTGRKPIHVETDVRNGEVRARGG
jgi:2-hydroxychromene-2-carboxylate isomerase